jgi:hypothetical protein
MHSTGCEVSRGSTGHITTLGIFCGSIGHITTLGARLAPYAVLLLQLLVLKRLAGILSALGVGTAVICEPGPLCALIAGRSHLKRTEPNLVFV